MNFNLDWDRAAELIWLILPLVFLHAVLFIAALVSILRKEVTRGEKLPWILLALIIQVIGPIIYFVVGAGMLDQKIAQREDYQ